MPRPQGMEDLKLEGVQLCFRNFEGREEKYNPPGRRVFNVILPPDKAEFAVNTGWHVKWLQPKVPGVDPVPYISVSVSYKIRPPKIVMYCGKKKVLLTEENVSQLDGAEIINCDVVLSPNQTNGPLGSWVRAYLSVMHVTIAEDPFADKYADPTSEESDLPWIG